MDGCLLDPAVWAKVRNHPCYSEEAHHHYARMHVAVAPACNIQCRYCNRKYDCANESRPGVVSERLTPEEAVRKVLAVAAAMPHLSVVGIAGPGDALANPDKTFRTLELIAAQAPDLRLCLSTNGLALPDCVDRIKALNVEHVTITINMVEPEVGERIYSWVYYERKRWQGREAAQILSERQLAGLAMLAAGGVLCKVNSVLIPGVNDDHLVDVNQRVKSLGAFIHNIMPLIAAPEHGTYYGLTGQREPTVAELRAVQDRCEGQMSVMRHCHQCRADAVGLLGHDRGGEFSREKLRRAAVADDVAQRRVYQAGVAAQLQEMSQAREAGLAALRQSRAGAPSYAADLTLRVAVATKGQGLVNEHFGHAREFQIYDVSWAGSKYVGHRRVDPYCQGGDGEDETLDRVIQALSDCAAVFVARIGSCPKEQFEAAGLVPVDRYAYEFIEPALLDYFHEAMAARFRDGEMSPALAHPSRSGGVRR